MNYYYIDKSGEVAGPISAKTLGNLVSEGALKTDTQVCEEGSEQWVGLSDVLNIDTSSPVEADALKFSCPNCNQHIAGGLSDAGITTECPSCGAEIQVPSLVNDAVPSATASQSAISQPRRPRSKKTAVFGAVGGLLALGIFVVVSTLGGAGGGSSPNSENYKEAMDLAWQYLDEVDDADEVREENWTKAVKLLKKPANRGFAEAQAVLALLYSERGEKEESTKWFTRLKKSAEEGDAEAQFFFGCYYLETGDDDEFAKWLTRSAYQDYAPAQAELGIAFQRGDGVRLNAEEGFSWLQKAVQNGDTDALHSLAKSYQEGIGVSKNTEKAFDYYTKSAAHGNAESMHELYSIYYRRHADGIEEDLEEALKWLHLAAKNGAPGCQKHLAYIYAEGTMTQRDPIKSVQWMRKAAENGDAYMMFLLGRCYRSGFGVTPDSAEAQRWITKATEHGVTSITPENARLFEPGESQEDYREENRKAVRNFNMRYRIAEKAESVGSLEKILGAVDSTNWSGVGPEFRKAVEDVKALKTGDSKTEAMKRLEHFSDLCERYE